ncbi:MAG TPA: hypothetical protein VN255_08210, partial [Mycobacterium sp.]|nr:hypothetical protein [Mycobacterium sp.]HWT48546.1 hypothetical protein [Mycobacterium sp.]
MTAARSAAPTVTAIGGLSERLAAVVRPEFRVDVLVPAVGDPILGTPACVVPGCVRSTSYGRLCQAHYRRWTSFSALLVRLLAPPSFGLFDGVDGEG